MNKPDLQEVPVDYRRRDATSARDIDAESKRLLNEQPNDVKYKERKQQLNKLEIVYVCVVLLGIVDLGRQWQIMDDCYLPANFYLMGHYVFYILAYFMIKLEIIDTKRVIRWIVRPETRTVAMGSIAGIVVTSAVIGFLTWIKWHFQHAHNEQCQLSKAFRFVAFSDIGGSFLILMFLFYLCFFETVKP